MDAALPAPLDRLLRATNEHDLQGLVGCFTEDYRLVAPAHPARDFTGRGQVCRNWAVMFAAVPDLSAEVLAWCAIGERVWTEWEMRGTRSDGVRHLLRGVIVFTVAEDLIRAARFFLEPVDSDDGGDLDAAVRVTVGQQR